MRLQQCCHCDGRFGLVSHRFLFKRFCSRACLGAHQRDFAAAIAQRAGRWWSFLLTPMAFSHAERPMKMSAVARPLRKRTAGI
jgi:hypothetical protein